MSRESNKWRASLRTLELDENTDTWPPLASLSSVTLQHTSFPKHTPHSITLVCSMPGNCAAVYACKQPILSSVAISLKFLNRLLSPTNFSVASSPFSPARTLTTSSGLFTNGSVNLKKVTGSLQTIIFPPSNPTFSLGESTNGFSAVVLTTNLTAFPAYMTAGTATPSISAVNPSTILLTNNVVVHFQVPDCDRTYPLVANEDVQLTCVISPFPNLELRFYRR